MRSLLLRESCVSVVLVSLLAIGVLALPSLAPLRNVARDVLIRAAAAWPPARPSDVPDAVIVALDRRSMREHRDWPWPRQRWAGLVDRLHANGARAIVFDIDFSTPREPEGDAALGRAIERSGRVVLGAFRQFERIDGIGELETADFPAPSIGRGAALVGMANLPLDADGTVRRGQRFLQVVGRELPSLPLAALSVAVDRPATDFRQSGFLIDFRRARPPLTTLSAADVLDGRYARDDVQGKVVFVGATALILQDIWATPLAAATPGVEVQATQYRHHAAEFAGHPVLRGARVSAQIAFLVMISVLARVLGFGTPVQRVLASVVVAGGVVGSTLLLTCTVGILIGPTAPLFVCLAHYVLGTERIRREVAVRLAQRERSISSLARVGELASDVFDRGGRRTALSFLGRATAARSLALHCLDSRGDFEAPLVWSCRGAEPPPLDPDTARRALGARKVSEVCDAESERRLLYVPLVAGAEAVGVLAVEHAREQSAPPDLETTQAVATLIALAIFNDRLIRKLRTALDGARAAARSKSDFLANMSHEIRTPMTAVLGYLDVLSDPETPERNRDELVSAMRRNGTHLLNVLNDILDLSQLEAGRIALRIVPVDPREICSEMQTFFRAQAEEKGLRFELELDEAVAPLVRTDPVRVRQVLINLLSNAVKFTDQGFVRLTLQSPAPGRLRFDVTDSGIGLDPSQRERVFERFAQADASSTRERAGAGLGLSIVRELAGMLDAALDLTSTRGEGSTFALEIPVVELRDVSLPDKSAAAPTVVEALDARVLVAEDSPDNQRIVRAFLERVGVTVDIAQNGRIACERIEASLADEPYDAVLMDVDMPECNGLDATRRARAAGFGGPIIALTAHALAGDRERCLEAGCDAYLTKPIDRARLLGTLSEFLGKPEMP